MICELHIDYADGTHEVICSDGSWRTTADGPYRSNDIYSGDVYDAVWRFPAGTVPDSTTRAGRRPSRSRLPRRC